MNREIGKRKGRKSLEGMSRSRLLPSALFDSIMSHNIGETHVLGEKENSARPTAEIEQRKDWCM